MVRQRDLRGRRSTTQKIYSRRYKEEISIFFSLLIKILLQKLPEDFKSETKAGRNQEEASQSSVKTRWRPSSSLLTNQEELRTSRTSVTEKLGGRLELPDDVWVTEISEDKVEQEKEKTRRELDQLKQSRLETIQLERPSSRIQELARLESRKELEEIKKVRSSMTETFEADILIIPNSNTAHCFFRMILNAKVQEARKKGGKSLPTLKMLLRLWLQKATLVLIIQKYCLHGSRVIKVTKNA